MLIRRTFSSCSFGNFQAVTTLDKFLQRRKRTWYDKKVKALNLKYVPESWSTENKDNLSSPSPSLLTNKKTRDVRTKLALDNERILYVSKLIDCDREKVIQVMKSYPQFSELSTDVFDQRISYLDQQNVDRSRILKLLWIILSSSENLEKSTEKISTALELEFECAISLVKLAKRRWLEKIKNLWNEDKISAAELFSQPGSPYRNRVDYMAHKLECKPWFVTDMMAVMPIIAEHSFDNLKNYMRILVDDALIVPREIINNPGLFQRDLKLMDERVKILKEHNCYQITLSLLRASPQDFDFHVSQLNQGQSLLETHSSLFKFLKDKLHCGDVTAWTILMGVPELRKMELSEIERKIQKIVLSQGFLPVDLRTIAGFLCVSDSKIEEEYNRFKALNVPPENFKKLYKTVLRNKYGVSSAEQYGDDEEIIDYDDW